MTLVTSGCVSTRTEYVYIEPDCSVPVQPSLPRVSAAKMFDALGAEDYNNLVERESRLVTWALEMDAILRVVCKK